MGSIRLILTEVFTTFQRIFILLYSALGVLAKVSLGILQVIGRLLIESLRALRAVSSPLVKIQNKFLEQASSILYALLPKEEGEIDENLREDLQRRLLITGARFRGFNRSVGNYTAWSLLITIFLFITALILVGITTGLSNILPEVLVQTVLVVMGLLGLAAIVLVGIANALLLLYLGSLLWYGIRKIRSNITSNTERKLILTSGDSDDLAKYKGRVDDTDIEVYRRNFGGIVRSFLYVGLIIVIGLYWAASPLLVKAGEGAAAEFPIQNLFQTPLIPVITNTFQGVNALFPQDLAYFLNPRGLESLAILTCIVLAFSIFLNAKQIIQHAELSQIDYSPIEPFTASGEFDRSNSMIEVCFYHIIEGELEEQYRDIRGEIIEAGFVVLILSILSAFYLYVVLNAV